MTGAVRCKHRLPGPEIAGAVDWDTLRQWAARWPRLRPCPRHRGERGTWGWIDRTSCEKCPDAVREGVA